MIAAVWHGGWLFTSSKDATVARWHPAEPDRPAERVRGAAAIHHLALDPQGRWLVAGSGQDLIVWPLRAGDHRTLAGHTDKVRALAFHPEGSFLLSSDFKGSLLAWAWDADTLEAKHAQWQAPDQNRIESIAFDRRGQFFVTGGLQGVQLWRSSVDDVGRMSIKVEALAGMQDYVVRVAVAPSGGAIAAQSYSGRCAAWLSDDDFRVPVDLGSGVLPKDPFGAGGFGLITVGRDEPRIDYHDAGRLREGMRPLELRGDDSVRPVVFLPDGFIAAGDDSGVLRCWSGETEHPQQVWVPEPGLDLNRVVISAGACVVLTASERFARGRELDRTARLVDCDTKRHTTLEGFEAGVDAVALSGDGTVLALGGRDATGIVLMNRVTGSRRALPADGHASCAALSADGRWLAAGMGDKVRIWDLSRDAPAAVIASSASIIALAFDPHAERLAVSVAGGVVAVWDL